MRICILNLYFGKLPDYFDLFLMSCEKNPKVDFLFFVDLDIPYQIPANVKFIYTTFNEIVSLFQSKFNFDVTLNTIYKICDFRPAFGEIFHDYLKDYDWWGHCDFDMVFGDLRPAVKLAEESKHVKIFRQGHLTLFKNEPRINQVYRNDFSNVEIDNFQLVNNVKEICPNDGMFMSYREVFTSEKFFCFDEYWGIDRLFYLLKLPVYRVRLMADIYCRSTFLKMTAHPNHIGQYFIWCNGTLIRKSLFLSEKSKVTYIYLHMQKRKMKQNYDSVDYKSTVLINQFGLFDGEKWLKYHYVFALISCIPNLAHLYRYCLPRVIKHFKKKILKFENIMQNCD